MNFLSKLTVKKITFHTSLKRKEKLMPFKNIFSCMNLFLIVLKEGQN